MRVSFHLSVEDCDAAWRARTARNRRIRRFIILATFAVLFGLAVRSASTRAVGVLVLFGLVALASIPVETLLMRRSFEKACRAAKRGQRTEVTAEISERGLEGVDTQSMQEWSHFSGFSESDSHFILYHAGMIEAIFPKRAFDASGVDRFRDLLRANIRAL